MSWQKCPICNGNGFIGNKTTGTVPYNTMTCPTCNGYRIINEMNGVTTKPPC